MDKNRLFPIVLILFTNLLGAGVIIPILPLFAQGEFRGSIFQITLLATAFFGAQFYADHVLFASLENQAQVQLFIGLMLTFLGLAQVVTQMMVLRPLIQRLGERRLILVGEIALLATLLGIVPTRNPIVFTLLLIPLAFGIGVSEPSLQ